MRVIGLDVHRSFAEVAILENGTIKHAGRLKLEHQRVVAFGKALKRSDEVVLEATGNTGVIVRLLMPFVRRVVVANPLQVRSIAWAKVKTDKIDAALLAKLHASGFLPEVWVPNEETEALRRRIAERNQLVSQMTRLKNRVQSVLHANLIPRYAGKLFSKRGRTWFDTQPLPEDQRRLIVRHLGEHDRIAVELAAHEKSLAEDALGDKRVKRLMTTGGVNAIVALGVLAAIGDVARFSSPQKLVSYFGLNPKVRQSGDRPAYHGRISRQGRAHARAMLVEAAWSIATQPGPLRAFFARIKQRRGQQIAAVATARKVAVLIWHLLTKEEENRKNACQTHPSFECAANVPPGRRSRKASPQPQLGRRRQPQAALLAGNLAHLGRRQDQSSPSVTFGLQHTAGPYIQTRSFGDVSGMSALPSIVLQNSAAFLRLGRI